MSQPANLTRSLLVTLTALLALAVAACVPIQPVAPSGDSSPSTPGDAAGDAAAALTGATWQLVEYLDASDATVSPTADATLSFQDGQAGGSTGCNSYGAGYTLDGDKLTFNQTVSTMMACDAAIMTQEQDFLARLAQTATYAVVDGQLQLRDASGKVLLTFAPQQAASLTGTTWTATTVNNGQQAVTSLVAGSEITLVFGDDGRLSGKAGCNNYNATYTVDGDKLTIGQPASTRMMCVEPAGVMEQEAAYLQLLPTAATYSLQGDTLEIRTADGALLVSFTAQ